MTENDMVPKCSAIKVRYSTVKKEIKYLFALILQMASVASQREGAAGLAYLVHVQFQRLSQEATLKPLNPELKFL